VDEAFDETAALRRICPDSIIVVMTGVQHPDITRKAMASGADNVAFKPFQFSILDLARLIVVGAINAMHRGASSSPRILENVCSMALKYFQHRHSVHV
jgi:DNA-binding NarL/FixJ family response regulator